MDNYDFIVLGDVNLDWACVGNLSYPFASLITNGVIEWRDIEELPGGSGLIFARFASEMGFHTLLLGKIGADPAGSFIADWLQENRLAEGLSYAAASTGKAFISRDQHDIRFLVNNTPNANRELTVEDVEKFSDQIAHACLLYISGYCFMDPTAPRTQAALRAIEIARTAGHAKIVLDVVPHQIYKIYDFTQFKKLTAGVDILVSETSTLRRFLNLGDRSETITAALSQETVRAMKEYYPGLILRYGPSGCDTQLIWNGVEQIFEETGHALAFDKRGFGDRLTIESLETKFGISPSRPKK
jgi:sugar/nucleoside kinase (ribokinase family)